MKSEIATMSPAWIDAHCHLADPRFDSELDAIIARSRAVGVTGWIQGGVEPVDWSRQLELRARFGPGFVTAFGLHPWWVAQAPEAEIEPGLKLLRERAIEAQAIGETGIDRSSNYADPSAMAKQVRAFQTQVDLARELQKPLILHVVRAHGHALEVLEKQGAHAPGGLVHHFSGSLEVAKRYLKLGFLISVGGAASREGYGKLKDTLRKLSSDQWVIETDSPDQPLKPGSLNEPAALVQVAQGIAEQLGCTREELLEKSTASLQRIFKTASLD